MPDVDSTAIDHISYDELRSILHVRFISGRDYAYFDVPRSIYEAFLDTESKGAFFNHRIRDKYRYREGPKRPPEPVE